jgi:uncharacterized protein YgbK (DUF1537 family)
MAATLIADDLTGACDAGAPFCGRGRVGVFTDAARAGAGWEVLAADTESRALPPAEAAGRVREVAGQLGPRLDEGLLFKKIDSTLRGPVGAELEALLHATGRRRALVCPAFPEQQRTVAHGLLYVSGVPAHESPVGSDREYPHGTSRVTDIVARGLSRPVRHLSLGQVRGEDEALVQRMGGTGQEIIVADAETNADLAALARAALAHPDLVLAGSAGLAQPVAAALGYAGPPAPLPQGRAWLIVAGSRHPATRLQIEALRGAGTAGAWLDAPGEPAVDHLVRELGRGRPVFLITGDGIAPAPDAHTAMAARLGRLATAIVARSRPDLVVATGGETAHALLEALGASRLDLLGAPRPGLALGDVVVDSTATLRLLTKAGGFGGPGLLLALLEGTP